MSGKAANKAGLQTGKALHLISVILYSIVQLCVFSFVQISIYVTLNQKFIF